MPWARLWGSLMANGNSSKRASLFTAGIIALGVFTVATVSDVLVMDLNANPLWALADHVALGLFAGAIVLIYDQRRRRDLHHKLSTIHEINHHIRNQLEVIEYSAWATHDQEHMARMHESVERIDWALREILGAHEGSDLDGNGEAPPKRPPQSASDSDDTRAANQ
jgi:hypothetical protein